MGLVFNEAAHSYLLDGKRVRGVTGLIDGGTSKAALVKWAPRFVAQFVEDNWDRVEGWHYDPNVDMVKRLKYLPENYRDEAGLRGSAIHTAVEEVVMTGSTNVDPIHLPEVNALLDLYEEWDIRPLEMTLRDGRTTLMAEKSVGNRKHWYAGRFDLIGTVGKLGGALCQIDTKSSNGVYGSMSMQLAAYRGAEFWVDELAPDVEYPMPVIERNLIAHVKRVKGEDGEPDTVSAGLQAVSGGLPYTAAQSARDMDEAFREFLWAASLTKTAGARDKRMWPVMASTTNHVFKEIAS
jgi:hypothetical protein